ncbi:hypothetical protein AB0H43_03040 [Hamadaea sp. NPDC050747]|uniref:hypothetical protein n=1 Tax=Hamadaea sp. NPDC050747 TaxID=3155789 RepID=UPI00340638D1
MTTWHYLAQRATTGEWLHRDLPLQRDELTWSLSGPGALRGTLTPDVGGLIADDGLPLIDEWGTLIYAEADGEIRWGGIVVRTESTGSAWAIEATGFASYPHGIPYLGEYVRIGIDPTDAVREIWAHVQAQPDGDLGVVVDSTTTPVRIGTAAYQEVELYADYWVPKSTVPASQLDPKAQAKLKAEITSSQTSIQLASLGGFDKLTPPYTATIGSETIYVTDRSGTTLTGVTRGYGTSSPSAHNSGTLVTHEGTPERTHDAEPYSLVWWEAPDCGSELDTLSQVGLFDYAEEHTWDGEDVAHRIRIGYPRLGRRRDDLAFIQGDNVVSVVMPARDGADLANEVIGLGAGEGRKTVQRRIPVRDGRLRRTAVYSDKSVTGAARMDTLCRLELATRQHVIEVTSVEVIQHPNALIGSWQLGDDVLIQATVAGLGDIAIWHRITGWSLLSEDRAALSLRRSDAFTYGG